MACGEMNPSRSALPGLNRAMFYRETGQFPGNSQRVSMLRRKLPVKREGSLRHQSSLFCGSFSKDGNVYMSAAQDGRVRLFEYPTFTKRREIRANDIGWSIVDTDYSPDQRFLIYSSWSPYGLIFDCHPSLVSIPHLLLVVAMNSAPVQRDRELI